MELQRAQEIVTEFERLRAQYPDASRAELAALIPRRRGGGLGISLRALNNAFALVRNADRHLEREKKDRKAALRSLIHRKLAQVQHGQAPRRPERHFSGPGIALADLHLSDIDCLWDSFRSAWEEAVAVAAEAAATVEADEVFLLVVGDLVSGKGIFRGQEVRNILGNSAWQALVGGYVLRDLLRELEEECGLRVRALYVAGNHDQDRDSHLDLGFLTADQARRLGADVAYSPTDAVVFLDGTGLLALHGTGYSQYRPQSPAFQNAIIRRVLDLNMGRPPREQVRRVVHGHQHWLDTGFQIGQWGLAIDSLGGWQRNARKAMARTSRPVGLIVYVPQEEGLAAIPVSADPKILAEETSSPLLEARNVQRVGEWLEHALEEISYEL